jgi:hypothetical protein
VVEREGHRLQAAVWSPAGLTRGSIASSRQLGLCPDGFPKEMDARVKPAHDNSSGRAEHPIAYNLYKHNMLIYRH